MGAKIRNDGPVMEVRDGVYRTHHDVSDGGLCLTITEALAEIEDVDPAHLIGDFARYVDPDALERLFRRRPNGDLRDPSGKLTLNIQGSVVTVHADGEIIIEP